MGLPLPLGAAARLFLQRVTVYDVVASRVDGREQTVVEPDRIIAAVIQTLTKKDVLLGPDGALSEGSILLHTRAAISAYDLSQDGQVSRQTYAKWNGEQWKVQKISNWVSKTEGYTAFVMIKWTDIDVP